MRLRVKSNRKGEEYVKKWPEWVKRDGKNWAAVIEGPDPKYKLARKFLNKVRDGREKYFLADEFIPNQFYQFRSSQKHGNHWDHEETVVFEGYFKCLKRTDEFVELVKVEYQEVLDSVKDPVELQIELAEDYINRAVKLIGKDEVKNILEGL